MASYAGSALTGQRKAAILLVTMGAKLSSEIFKHLTVPEIEQLSLEIATLGEISEPERDYVLREFNDSMVAQEYLNSGGPDYAKSILEGAFGLERANDILERLSGIQESNPFELLRRSDPRRLISFIHQEHPQTIALVTAHLRTDQAAQVLASLSEDMAADVARRIATMDRTSPEVIREVGKVLGEKVASVSSQSSVVGGTQAIVDILNKADQQTENSILRNLEDNDPEMAQQIKNLMFLFEDIKNLDNNSIQRMVKELDSKDLALALKGASQELRDLIFKNMSERAALILQEDIDVMGPVRLRRVEEAQQRIVNIVRKLEESGEITISRGEDDAIVE